MNVMRSPTVAPPFYRRDGHPVSYDGFMSHAFVLGLAAFLLATSFQAAPAAPVRTVERVDVSRYLGDWFEVARYPNRFQRQCAGDVVASYAKRSDGRIDVVNRCRATDGTRSEAKGIARVVDTRTSAKLKVRFAPALLSFLPGVWGDYWILGLADDYAWAIVGSPNREYLWILARTRDLDARAYASALESARSNGFDVERLVKTPR
jgi:apolipoprotein D and lipocalin family protein